MAENRIAENQGRAGIAQVFSGVVALVGLWLIFSPWLLGYMGAAKPMWNDVLAGAAILLLALIRFAAPARHVAISCTNMALGVWLILAPFVLAYGQGLSNVATWNDIVAGVVVIASAWLSAETTRRITSLGN